MNPIIRICILLVLAPSVVAAEESIFDEENPAVETDTTEDAGEEIIFDDEPTPEVNIEPPKKYDVTVVGTYSSIGQFDTKINNASEDIVEWRNLLTLTLDAELAPQWRFLVGAELEHWTGGKENPTLHDLYINPSNVRTDAELRLGEAFVVYRTGDWTFAAGNMITRWGTTDISRPSDVINPVDQTAPIGPSALPRLPQLTFDASVQLDSVNIQLLMIPFFKADRSFLFGRDSALLNAQTPLSSSFPISPLLERLIDPSLQSDVQPLLLATEVPEDHPGNASLGIRTSTTVANTDLALAYFFGFDRTPTVEVAQPVRELFEIAVEDEQVFEDLDLLAFIVRNPATTGLLQEVGELSATGESALRSRHERRHTLSAEAARYLGPIGVRTDVAFMPEQTYFTTDFSSVRRPTLSGALGLSYERLQDENDALTLTVEGFFTHVYDHDSSVTETFVETRERGSAETEILFFSETVIGTAAALVWAEPITEGVLTVGARSDFTNRDLVVSSSVSRRWSSLLETSIGFTLFEGFGDKLSVGRAFDGNDNVWIRLSGAL